MVPCALITSASEETARFGDVAELAAHLAAAAGGELLEIRRVVLSIARLEGPVHSSPALVIRAKTPGGPVYIGYAVIGDPPLSGEAQGEALAAAVREARAARVAA